MADAMSGPSAVVPALSTAAGDDEIVAAVSARAAARGEDGGMQHACSISGSHSDDDDEDDDEEAAGLVSRLSDEEDRAERRLRYTGMLGGKSGKKAANGHSIRLDEMPDGDDEELGDRPALLFDADGADDDDVEASRTSRTRDDAHEGLLDEHGTARSGNPFGNGHAPPFRQDMTVALPGDTLQRKVWLISREALPTLLLSLTSLLFSGELLIHLARWPVFSKVDKLFILIPILLNLKGNLEGNLSLRMSTSANIGELDLQRTRETLIFGNLALLQVQALIVSLFAGVLSFVLGLGSVPPKQGDKGRQPPAAAPSKRIAWSSLVPRKFHLGNAVSTRLEPRRVINKPKIDPSIKLRNSYFEFVLVIATATLSASISSATLGSFMCALVVMSRQNGINPDNIASPLAGSLGDLLTLSILGMLAAFLVQFEGTILATLILVVLSAACAAFFLAAYRNAYVRELLSSGWVPLLVAMFISSGAGLVLDSFVQRFEGYALLAPAMTGMPGACAAIFVSRTSTALHAGASAKSDDAPTPPGRSWLVHNEEAWHHRYITKFTKNMPAPLEGWLVPCVLGGICFSILLTFLGIIRLTGQMTFGLPFAFACSTICILNVTFGLVVSHCLCLALWRADFDPDIYSLPFVSSIIDVSGQLLLVTAYYFARALGDTITAAVNDGQR